MKYRTKLILADAAREIQEFDVEALTATEAGQKAASHWGDLWRSSKNAAIHVYEINAGTGDAYSTCALVIFPTSSDFELDAPKEKRPDKVSTTKRSRPKSPKASRTRRT